MDIQARLENISTDEERHRFLQARSMLRKSYLTVFHATVGIEYWSVEDDSFLDAVDMKIEMLLARAGQPTDTRANEEPNQRSDPFAHITRPTSLLALEQSIADEIKKIADDRQKQQPNGQQRQEPNAQGWTSRG